MLPATLGFLSGTVAVQQLAALPPWPVQWVGWLVAAGLGLFLHRCGTTPCRWPMLVALLKALLGGLLGSLWAMSYAAFLLNEGLPSADARRTVLVQGTVVSIPERQDRGIRFEYLIDQTHPPSPPLNLRRVRLTWYNNPGPLRAGEVWQFRLRLRTPHGSLNPGSLDYEGWLFAEGIRAVGYVVTSTENRRLGAVSPLSMPTWRQALYDRLQAALADRPYAGVIEALVMGVESGISPAQWETLRLTGTTHLIAISGSHIGLMAGLGFWLCRRLAGRIGWQRIAPYRLAALGGIVVAGWYAALADFAIPTRRALVMVAVVMGAIVLKRHPSPLHTLAVAGFAVTLLDPLVGLSAGFWLSFAAVGLILYGSGGRLAARRWGDALLRINGLTAVGLIPLLLLFFQQVSLISPLANALAVPVLGVLLVPVCLVGALLLAVQESWGIWLLQAAERIVREFWQILEWLAGLPLAQWHRPAPSLMELCLALAGLLLLLAPRGIPGRWLGGILCLPLVVNRPESLPGGVFRLTLLDVGQGLAATVETGHHLLVFDTGARFSASFDMGRAVVEPYLRHRGWNQVDVLVVSHGDNDHSGGARSLLRDLPVTTVLSSVPGRLPPPVWRCEAGQGWNWEGVHFSVLAPLTALARENDNSCVLRVEGADGSVLLTGDIEADGEQALVNRYGAALASTVLIVPHHGSNTSSTARLLDTVKPTCGLIPDGHLNRYGFPHRPVLERYRERNISLFETARSGALLLRSDQPVPCAVQGYRQIHRRYWHAGSAAIL